MKLQTGKYYRTKAGRRVGPMLYEDGTWHQDGCEQVWHGDGIVMLEDGDESHDYIVAEWGDDDTPKLWRDMTPEEKGVLLLAHHEGKVIECYNGDKWFESEYPAFMDDQEYRIRPEPKVETVTLWGGIGRSWNACSFRHDDTHRITFETIDGKPDCASIKMEEIR